MVRMGLIAKESMNISCKIKVQMKTLQKRRNKEKISLFRFKLGQINEGNENKKTGNRVLDRQRIMNCVSCMLLVALQHGRWFHG